MNISALLIRPEALSLPVLRQGGVITAKSLQLRFHEPNLVFQLSLQALVFPLLSVAFLAKEAEAGLAFDKSASYSFYVLLHVLHSLLPVVHVLSQIRKLSWN